MRFSARISAWSLFGWVLALAWCVGGGGRGVNAQPTRCLALCLRSETEDSCQRCRLRVPMRFGKRVDAAANGRLRIPMRFGKRRRDNEEDDSASPDAAPGPPASAFALRSRQETSPVRPNRDDNSDVPEKWFFRVLNEPSLAYDNPSDYD